MSTQAASTARRPRVLQAARSGLWLGAGAGLLAALNDYGAEWLWVPSWRDRWELLLRLLAFLPALGSLLGAAVGALWALGMRLLDPLAERLGRRDEASQASWRRRLLPLPAIVLTAGPLGLVAWASFQGARASRLPGGPVVWSAVATVLVLLGLYVALRLLAWAVREAPRRRRLAWTLTSGLLLGQFLLSKADQVLFPKLYEPLHALLAASAASTSAAALALLARLWPGLLERTVASPGRSVALTAILLVTGAAHLLTLERNANVQVALFEPRAATSRSAMLGLRPLLPRPDAAVHEAALARAREARRRRARHEPAGLPTVGDAHLLLVTVDALRADHLGLYGYARPTSPFLDALARESVVFERAYAQAPHSSYSLCSLMTSEYLHETVELGLPLPEATLATVLGEAGYETAAFYTPGIFHTEGEKLRRYDRESFGFRRYDHADTDAERRTDAVLEEMDRLVAAGEPPGFFWIHYFDVHEPYRDERFGPHAVDRYDGEIARVDAALKRLWEEASRRLSRPVVLVVTADHGEEFREHGGVYHGSSLYDEQVRVPLLVHAPGLSPRRIGAPVELVDVAPTLLGLLELPVAESMRGDDLRPLMAGQADSLGPAFSAVMRKRMVTDGRYKLVAELRYGLYELYDLRADPHERRNLASERAGELQRLLGELHVWLDALQRPPGSDLGAPADPLLLAFQRARLGDARAVDPLADLVADPRADPAARAEAARLLGRMNARDAANRLARALRAEDSLVRAEAAIALGRIRDARAREELRRVVHAEAAVLRARAGIALGRLEDPEAVGALLDAVRLGPTRHDRFEAVRRLGELGGPEVVQPLVDLLDEFRLRKDAIVALGRLGDRRAAGPLLDVLRLEYRPTMRDAAVEALARVGATEALEDILALAREDGDLLAPPEALLRLGALRKGLVGGIDLGPRAERAHGRQLTDCRRHASRRRFLGTSFCETRGSTTVLKFRPPPPAARHVLLLRGRRLDTPEPVDVVLRLGRHRLGEVRLEGAWRSVRLTVDGEVRGRRLELRAADEGARLALDYVLLLPAPAPLAAAPHATPGRPN